MGEVHIFPQEPATTRGNTHDRPRKNPNSDELGFCYWWSWGDLNPRPQAFFAQFYMCSRLFCVSPDASRSDTLRIRPAPYCLAPHQGARCEASRYEFPCSLEVLRPPCPAYRPTVARLTGLSGECETFVVCS